MPVHIAPDLFVAPGEWEPTPEWYLTVTDDVATALPALTRAAQRILCTDEAGVEHPDYEAANAGGESAPPSYVSDPESTSIGIVSNVDCQGNVFPDQAAAFRSILSAEMERAEGTVSVRNMTHDEVMAFLNTR